jgi:hypothetical protein
MDRMLGTLVATTALALGLPTPSAPPSGFTLVQLTRAAACTETVPLLEAGATVVSPSLRVFRLPAGTASRLATGLRARHALQTIEPDRALQTQAATDTTPDPLEAGEWWRSVIGIDGLTPPGPGKPVTIVDSGLDLQHPDFLNRPDTIPLNAQEPAPLGGQHGTAVASLIGAPQNGVGIVGVYPQAVIRSWDTALGTGTRIDTSEVVKGITAAADDGPGVINLSLGSTQKDDLVEQAIDHAYAKGSLVVVASGNDGDRGNPSEYPADYPHVLTIAATTRDNTVAGFSSRSPFVDLAAPGQGITVATAADNSWEDESGTSFSTPIVSGASAWVWTMRPQLDNTQLFEVMRRSAVDLVPVGRDDASGYGLLNVKNALALAAPVRDPLEPNDDVDFVKPTGRLSNGRGPLTSPTVRRAALTARLDRLEDPHDVYRIWIPARKGVTVTADSKASVALRAWNRNTLSVLEFQGADLMAKDVRLASGRKHLVLPGSQVGRWAFVDVTLGGRRGLAASYTLTVATR